MRDFSTCPKLTLTRHCGRGHLKLVFRFLFLLISPPIPLMGSNILHTLGASDEKKSMYEELNKHVCICICICRDLKNGENAVIRGKSLI